ncbi:MAG: VCBS repeat-containing protein [Rhodothermaceae bacterium]|nr:VCBS repeat-containing protein [Rhodothermaceae bacterium]
MRFASIRPTILFPVLLLAMLYLGAPGDLQAQGFTRVQAAPFSTDIQQSLGVAWGDYNDDGFLDVFIANGNTQNNLYTNNGDGTFTKETSGAIATDRGDSRGSLWADYDNDGDLDLYVSNRGGNVPPPVTGAVQANFLYQNDGPPSYTFTKITNEPVVTETNFTWSSSWVDYDNDGDLDLHMPDNLHAADDFFFTNDGTGSFTSTTPLFVEPGSGPSTGVASWIDFDNDGDQDVALFKSGRFLPAGAEDNRMFRNVLSETGSLGFEEITTGGIVTHFDNDFQASWADYDNDGDMDVFLGHAGGPRGVANYLYRNDGQGTFTQITSGPIVSDRDGTLGSGWGDYDNDGDLDLLVANGGPLDKLYNNNGDGTFTSMTQSQVGSIVSTPGNSWGAAWGDYDNDGFLDAIIINAGAANSLYHNDLANGNHWISIDAKGTTSNRSGIGAKVYAKATIFGESYWQLRHISGSPTGDRSQNSLRVHFGLGDATRIDSLRIEWPSGVIDETVDVPVDEFLIAQEGMGFSVSSVSSEKEIIRSGQDVDIINFPNPFKDTTTIRYTLHNTGHVRISVFDVLGRLVTTLVDSQQNAGTHEVDFNVHGLPSGRYMYRLETEKSAQTRLFMVAY